MTRNPELFPLTPYPLHACPPEAELLAVGGRSPLCVIDIFLVVVYCNIGGDL